MKRIFSLLVMTLFLACGQVDQSQPGLSGSFDNAAEVNIELTWFKDYFNNNRVVSAIEPDDQQSFTFPFDFQEPVSAGLRIGRTEVPLFISPDDALVVEADALQPLETIVFTGPGSDNNNFLIAFHREMELVIGDRFIAMEAGKRDAASFAALMDSIAGVKQSFFETVRQEASLTPAFEAYMETRLKYDHYTKLLEYPVLHQRALQSPDLVDVSPGYYDFLLDESTFDDAHLEHLPYVNFLMAYLGHLRRQHTAVTSHEEKSINQQTYYLAGEMLTGNSRNFIQAMMVGRELSYGVLDDAEQIYQLYVSGQANEAYKERINSIYKHMQTLYAGNPAPDFTMTDIDGREVSLSDFRGKVIVLDFWASWCGPCMREMPHVKALKEQFADREDLVFVYVSIDTDVEAWKSTVERLDLEGVHFNTPGRERGVPLLYNVKWIPTFYVIGKDGLIADNRPPLPSQGGLDELVAEALGI
jgi:thiol-disulfide isomerase/thioredoxin